jgi:hypothetical protein
MGFFVLGFIGGIALMYLMYFWHKPKFQIGDIVYLKPTGQKCIIWYKACGYWLKDMDGYCINEVPYHKNLLDKTPPPVQ